MSVEWVPHVINNVPILMVVITAAVILDMSWSIISFVMVSTNIYVTVCGPFITQANIAE